MVSLETYYFKFLLTFIIMESKDCPVSESTDCLVSESTDCPVSESTDCPVSESTDCPVSESTDCLVSESTDCLVSESTDCPVSESTDCPEQKSGKQNFIINVNFEGITAKNNIINKVDYDVTEKMYEVHSDDGFPLVYTFMYKYVKQVEKNKRIITFSPDPAMAAATIAGNAEKYVLLGQDADSKNPSYTSNMKIIYLTSTSHILQEALFSNLENQNNDSVENDLDNKKIDINVKNLTNSVISDLLCLNDVSFTNHEFVLSGNQFILIGINDKSLTDIETETLKNLDITYFTLDELKKKGIDTIIKSVKEMILDAPLHVVFDTSVMAYSVAPCTIRFFGNDMSSIIDEDSLKEYVKSKISQDHLRGLNVEEITQIFNMLSTCNIIGLDVLGYDLRISDKQAAFRVTCEIAKLPLVHLLKITEKKINIFNEDSKMLIWRPYEQKSEDDVGWYLLRNTSLKFREDILKHLVDDTIISHSVEDDDGEINEILLSVTTMNEQEKKTYLDNTTKISDCVLFVEEKMSMLFEMLNST